ncbi:MAG: O-antigen ligase family protein [Candidatus Aureabacteria bacterium]|nr:O-antigen ligase family protein [Candidatus Auribacterota bacterium]
MSSSRDNTFYNNKLLITFFLAVCSALMLINMSKMQTKWLLVFIMLVFFPIFVFIMGSLKKSLLSILIFSFSIRMDFNPWYGNSSFGIPISLTGIAIIALYILWFFEIMKERGHLKIFPSVTIPMAILVAWSGFSFLVAANFSPVLYGFTFALEFLLCYFYIANLSDTKTLLPFTLNCIAVTVIFSSSVGIIQYFFPGRLNLQFLGWENDALKLQYGTSLITRAVGFLGHANALATFLNCWLPILFVFSFIVEKSKYKILYMAALCIGIVALILTFSRGGWLAFFFSIVLVMVILTFQDKKDIKFTKITRVFIATVVVIFIAALPFYPYIHERLSRDDYDAATNRITLAKTALQIIKERPLTGTGLRNYESLTSYTPFVGNTPTVHNVYLHTAAELGIPAALIFIYIYLLFFFKGLSVANSGDRITALFSLGLISGLAADFLHGMFELGNIGDPAFLPVAFMGGLVVCLKNLQDKNKPEQI